MAITVPTLDETIGRAYNSFRTNLKGSDAWLWPNNVNASAKVLGATVHPAWRHQAWILRQAFAHLAEGIWLDRHADEWGLSRKEANFASGKVSLTGTTGTVVPIGLEFQRSDGARYEIISGTTLASGTGTVTVRGLDAGKAGNTLAGAEMTLTAAYSGLDSAAAVHADGIGLGADTESDESLRARILFRKQFKPAAGAAHDYVRWASEQPGVTRVYVDPITPANERTSVGIWFLMDETYPNGIPQAADVSAMEAYLDTLRPAGALIEVGLAVADPLAITITGLSPSSIAVQDAVTAELQAMFRRDAAVSTVTSPATLHHSRISEAISYATGEHHHKLTVPSADVTPAAGHIATLGSITFA